MLMEFEPEKPFRMTYGHVGCASRAPRLRFRVLKPTRDAKVAEFHVAPLVQEDVGGLDISVDDAVLLLEVVQCFHRLQNAPEKLS